MSEYYIEIQRVVNTALEELQAEHQAGKLADAPLANNHFLVHWVSKALKAQRFERCVVDDLNRWQKAGRSKGNQSELLFTFKRISAFYAHFFNGDFDNKITDKRIEAFLDFMEAEGWDVNNCDPLVNVGKVQIFTDGQNSFALCGDQCDNCFDGELMVKPMNWFVRGHHADFVEKAFQAGFMLYKRTDYKSNVKYHGEYLVYPNNQGPQVAEIPLGFKA
ncbi:MULTISPECIES: DUF2913 family protein [Vibrio]|uniref:Alpha-acetolactate decarboxylase n=1 Tax=Vibrio aestuarianus TaxID=28171 RepID=A0A7X6N8A4_9VIBR|nr:MULTISPECIES: DUF2913 family protein [Vibrio]KOE82566.1 alpha-acetolactate decarboxylase [Vibrio alginolyticus]MDE1214621.1 DUF2913 family protein [Vibrio aestuarianus]MDE1217034.1 DUF2913 family protein [Vibrio aestuarianus]MDE1219511.1 DUF2913 family protein [Vibrio aestuarianus]MDE1224178.1 DUF2913 family protein [Vibrio aestuarianus]